MARLLVALCALVTSPLLAQGHGVMLGADGTRRSKRADVTRAHPILHARVGAVNRFHVRTFIVVAASVIPLTAASAQKNVPEAIAEFTRADPGMAKLFSGARGYAIFPSVGKGAIGIGGARGKGWVYQSGTLIGQTTLTQLTIGLQLGGQAYREAIFFKDQTALDDFRRGNFELSAQASAVAVTAGASANAKYNGGVAIFTMTKGGLMYEASVGGQKFSFKPVGGR